MSDRRAYESSAGRGATQGINRVALIEGMPGTTVAGLSKSEDIANIPDPRQDAADRGI